MACSFVFYPALAIPGEAHQIALSRCQVIDRQNQEEEEYGKEQESFKSSCLENKTQVVSK